MVETIEMLFGELTRVGPKNHVLDGVETPKGMGNFWGLYGPLKSIGSLCCGVMQRKGSLNLQ